MRLVTDEAETASADSIDSSGSPPPRTVLVADDDAGARHALGQILKLSGYRVELANDGKMAVQRLKETRIDALVLDLHMTGSDGFVALEYIQEHRKSLPLVLLTGLSAAEIQSLMRESKVEELPPLLEKPCDPDQLLGVLDLMLRGNLPGLNRA